MGSLLILCVFVAGFIIFFYWLKSLPRNKIGDFPCPPGYLLLGHVPYVNTNDKVLPFIHRNLSENEGFTKLLIGLKPFLVSSDVKCLKWILNSKHITKSDEYQYMKQWLGQGLILATGQHWKLHRKILTPAFHFRMIENHVSVLRNTTSILIGKFEENLQESSLDVYPLITAFALDAVCESTMATSINAQKDDDSNYMKSMHNLCRIVFERTFDLSKMYDVFFKFHRDYRLFNDCIDNVNAFTISVIEKQRNELKNFPQSAENDAENIYERRKTPFIDILLNYKDENDQSLSDQEILEEVNTIIFAGYETTASSISFALYNLARYPEIQCRAFEEQKDIFGYEKNPFLTYADLNNMKYLETVIKESLRVYPAIPLIGRKIMEDTHYDGKLLPAGLTVILSLYTLHHDPELFPEPEKFDPSRFENETNLTPYTFLPFSAGQRNCIGQKFAMIEMKQVISTILRNFELLPVPNHILNIKAETSLKSSNGICIRLKKRKY